MFILALVGLVAGCASASEPAYDFGPSMSFHPEPELVAVAREDGKRWNDAAGLDIRVGDTGVPIRLVDQVYDPSGGLACGVTVVERDDTGKVTGIVRIDLTRNDSPRDCLLHEMLHAFAPQAQHLPEGMFAEHGDTSTWRIDPATLTEACSHVDCTVYQPEG